MGRIWWWMGGSVVFRVGGSVRLQGGTFARVEDWKVDTLWARSTKFIWEGEVEVLRVSNTPKNASMDRYYVRSDDGMRRELFVSVCTGRERIYRLSMSAHWHIRTRLGASNHRSHIKIDTWRGSAINIIKVKRSIRFLKLLSTRKQEHHTARSVKCNPHHVLHDSSIRLVRSRQDIRCYINDPLWHASNSLAINYKK